MRIAQHLSFLVLPALVGGSSCAKPQKYDPPGAPDGRAAGDTGAAQDGPSATHDAPVVDASDTADAVVASDIGADGAVDLPTATDGAADAEVRPNWMFTTSTSYSPDLGGLAGADAACMKRAQAANLTGTFVALLSTSTVDARSRLGNSRGWVRTDGKPFANTQQQIFTGAVRNAPMLDEFAKPIDPDTYAVFTASKSDGTRYADANTTDWTNPQPDSCRVGHSYKIGIEWLSGFTVAPCMGGYRLYCFEIGRFEPLP